MTKEDFILMHVSNSVSAWELGENGREPMVNADKDELDWMVECAEELWDMLPEYLKPKNHIQ